MISRIALTFAAATILAASTATLAAPPEHDDTEYPATGATWNGTSSASTDQADEGGDVTYPGTHATIVKSAPPPVDRASSLAQADDTAYPTADGTPAPSRPAEAGQRLACGCARR